VIRIKTSDLSKKYYRELIFKDFTYDFKIGDSCAVTGPNGSGKSTLLKVLAGIIPQSSGKLEYILKEATVDPDQYYQHLTFISPYLELIEEFTLLEFLKFHFQLKEFQTGFDIDSLLEFTYLQDARNKEIRNFSSGMKQRLKLSLAYCSNSEIVFLDEPTTNLDEKGVEWYNQGLKNHLNNRLLFIASNQLREYETCNMIVDIMDLKK